MKYLTDHYTLVAYLIICLVVVIVGQSFQNGVISQDDSCNLPAEPGFCYAYFPSFYYDSKSGRCMPFVYGGCGGNANRFESERECEKVRHRCLRTRGKINYNNQSNRNNRNIQF